MKKGERADRGAEIIETHSFMLCMRNRSHKRLLLLLLLRDLRDENHEMDGRKLTLSSYSQVTLRKSNQRE